MKEGWKYLKLGEIATEMYRGSGIKRDQITQEGFPCVRYGEIYTTYNYCFDKCVSHTNENLITSKKYFEHNDILFAITGESVEDIGKTIAYLGHEKCLAGGDIVVMKHKQNAKYISYALSSPNAIKQKGFGKTKLKVVHSSVPALKDIQIPVPPLPEQQRIVEYLDTQFAKIDALKANAAKQLQAAKDLFQSALKDLMTPKDGWEEKRINELGETKIGPFGSLLHKSDYIKNGIPLINPMHIKNSEIVADYNYSITKTKAEELNNYSLKTNDIIIGRRGEMGRCAVVDNNSNGWICGTGCLFFRPKTNVVNSKFLQLCISSDTYIAQLEHLAGGATMLNLNSKALSQLEFRLPSLKEQQEIIGVISQISSVISKLQSNYEQTITLCSDLKQSLLKQIFE